MYIYVLLGLGVGIGGVILFLVKSQKAARFKRLMSAPFSDSWQKIIEKNIPLYLHLPQELQEKLHGYINVFLAEKKFEGCGGQEITDEVRVTIAAQACLLLIGRGESHCYPKLYSILVYPHTYVAAGRGDFGGDIPSARLGESWQTGVVVLSWNSVKGGAVNFHDGQNVTLHEFAHQLDQEDGDADGTPILDGISGYKSWAHTFGDEYKEFLERVEKHKKTVIDEYGATNPAEYFATATEAFFEKPDQLHARCPELYNEIKSIINWIQ
jgi:Mlc titration factor MtfA (ptsG expression regulator)